MEKIKRNPRGAGRKPSGVAKYHTTIRVDQDCYDIIKDKGLQLGATINKALRIYLNSL